MLRPPTYGPEATICFQFPCEQESRLWLCLLSRSLFLSVEVVSRVASPEKKSTPKFHGAPEDIL